MDKSGFALVPSRLPDAVKLMTAFQPFRASSAFRELDNDDFALPGVVASAFARFVSELAVPARSSPDALTLLDELAEWGDLDVDNLLVIDVIESMDPEVVGALRPVMGARFNQLIDEYGDLPAR